MQTKVVAIIPTYKPSSTTLKLVGALNLWNPEVQIIVVDDCTPAKHQRVLTEIMNLTRYLPGLEVIHTTQNRHKSGALNFGLEFVKQKNIRPDIILTFDDDVLIEKDTITILTKALYGNNQLGAVCSLVKIRNKNRNLLTRLQSLEYHGFNITKLADNEVFQGPMVMPGMLTAFRYQALEQAGGFNESILIEDYAITARIKELGWLVRIIPRATSWTKVPDNLSSLRKQRIRWTYNGLIVLRNFLHYPPSVIQDVIGHLLFIGTLGLILLSLFMRANPSPPQYVATIYIVTGIQLITSIIYNTIAMIHYQQADLKDWFIYFTLIPKFVYSNILTLILLGSYFFYLYRTISPKLARRLPSYGIINALGLKLFGSLGYTDTWCTR
ncbi:glycosyltransferase family 2 protein [Patescibacteria group bacterium]|nr:glycosyltransferase family 2 protein [Patescibacteria group bacterium]MBU1868077.1 glycosyltransferase family 2 protein [Patescibacteria group bacterium]